MRKVRDVILTENKKIPIIMIGIAILMLLLSLIKIEIPFSEGIFNSLASVISVLPLTIGVSTVMLLKTKKSVFGEMQCYIIAVIVVMAFAILFLFDIIPQGVGLLSFALCVLIVYPYIVAGLTIRGCIYNKVFALMFAGILLAVSIIAVIAVTILLSGFSFTYLVLPLMYIELILNILCFELKPFKKNKENYNGIL